MRSNTNNEWTLCSYAKLCEAVLESGYTIQTVADYLRHPATPVVIMRHDIDRVPANAVLMAELEHSLGIRSTYYVRTVPSVFRKDKVAPLHELGHEVGYHYEVVAKTHGDMVRAAELFGQELAALRALGPVHTASSHGSPLSPWPNLSLWDNARPRDFSLLGEAYLDIDYSSIAYYTDTGRRWDAHLTNLRDRVSSGPTSFPHIRHTGELMQLLYERRLSNFCIQTHPERWNDSALGTFRSAMFDFTANFAKSALRLVHTVNA